MTRSNAWAAEPSERLMAAIAPTPWGDALVIVSCDGVRSCWVGEDALERTCRMLDRAPDTFEWDGPWTRGPVRWIAGYVAGRRANYRGALDPVSRQPFLRACFEAIRTIPWGQTRSYAEVAAMMGAPSRGGGHAAATCTSHCTLDLFVPCQRVIRADGTLAGMSGSGSASREALLAHEGWTDRQGRR